MSDWSDYVISFAYKEARAGRDVNTAAMCHGAAAAAALGHAEWLREQATLGKGILLPEGIKAGEVCDGWHTFDELYDHRVTLFLALMRLAHKAGLEAGWSRRHADGELCFGGGWIIEWIVTPSGLEARYHLPDLDATVRRLPDGNTKRAGLPADLERPVGRPWNGLEQTLQALDQLTTLI